MLFMRQEAFTFNISVFLYCSYGHALYQFVVPTKGIADISDHDNNMKKNSEYSLSLLEIKLQHVLNTLFGGEAHS